MCCCIDSATAVCAAAEENGRRRRNDGQASVEAVIMIPLLFLLILMLVQPGILLYNRIVMQNAAAEGLRLLSTRTDIGDYSSDKYRGYIERRLASIPTIDIFHAGADGGAWDIELVGVDTSSEVTIRITNKLKPLPLLDLGATLLRLTDGNGYLVQEVKVTGPTQPDWVWDNGGPADWASQW
ncbi:MAG TPA: pilus assembly protein TadE [Coriobacteriia bacterium]|nr:pilus assembly protein TadE [Coriobacteriia bacterium]